jgi:hypothetical protein
MTNIFSLLYDQDPSLKIRNWSTFLCFLGHEIENNYKKINSLERHLNI